MTICNCYRYLLSMCASSLWALLLPSLSLSFFLPFLPFRWQLHALRKSLCVKQRWIIIKFTPQVYSLFFLLFLLLSLLLLVKMSHSLILVTSIAHWLIALNHTSPFALTLSLSRTFLPLSSPCSLNFASFPPSLIARVKAIVTFSFQCTTFSLSFVSPSRSVSHFHFLRYNWDERESRSFCCIIVHVCRLTWLKDAAVVVMVVTLDVTVKCIKRAWVKAQVKQAAAAAAAAAAVTATTACSTIARWGWSCISWLSVS